jgi:hypothetical protein
MCVAFFIHEIPIYIAEIHKKMKKKMKIEYIVSVFTL